MKKAEDVLRAYIPMLGSREARDYLNVFSSWADILGDDLADIAAHSEPVDIKNGSLVLFVDHPGWMQKLEFHKTTILRRLKKRYPQLGIRGIFIQRVSNERFIERREARMMGDFPKPEDTRQVTSDDGPQMENSEKQTADDSVPTPDDPELAKTFERLRKLSRSAKKP